MGGVGKRRGDDMYLCTKEKPEDTRNVAPWKGNTTVGAIQAHWDVSYKSQRTEILFVCQHGNGLLIFIIININLVHP